MRASNSMTLKRANSTSTGLGIGERLRSRQWLRSLHGRVLRRAQRADAALA